MATIKFSDFTNQAVDAATTQLVGYKVGDATANYRYSIAQLATAISPSIDTIYTADSSLTGSRVVTLGANSLTFSGNLVKVVGIAAGSAFETEGASGDGLFKISNSGEFQLGVRASANSVTDVVIGSDSASTAQRVVSIGNLATTVTDDSINIGNSAKGTGATSITLNSSGGIAAPAVTSGFGVFMASNSFADFEVAGGVSKFSFDADSFATLTIADASDTTLASGETGDITIDAGGGVKIDADSGAITFADGGVTLATIATLRTESFIMAASDETTVLAVGTNKAVFRIPYAFTLTAVAASLTTAGTTSGLTTIDINEDTTAGGVTPVSILSTKITIDLTEKTSITAVTQPVISDASLAADSQITVDIDAISGGASETGLKVTLIGYQTV